MAMTQNNNSVCCSGTSGCCGVISNNIGKEIKMNDKKITIDFLYLDLSVCTRCQGTDNSLDEALSEIAKVLEATGYEVIVNKVEINSEELAIAYKFVSSPTIRVNGYDIQMDVKESLCESCGDLCGDEVDCRVWVYDGNEYNVPPKAMIVEAILKAVYGGYKGVPVLEQEYTVPENLRRFYVAMEKK